jgi:tetratricopeptide (TPR) repeat protein
MAGVFLSYDRDDSAAAKVIATALENAGHEVWWDLHVRGGAQFSKVIEEALKAADAVVVLWSANSVESAWVRDEAAAGRDSGRLIPATIDGTAAPLGFRQFQTIDVKDWKRAAKSRGYKEIEGAVQALAPAAGTPAHETEEKSSRRLSRRAALLIALPLLAAIAIAAYFLWPSASAAVPTVTVQPASSSAISQALSRDLLAKLGVLQASNSEALQLVEQGGQTPDLVFKVDASNDVGAMKATLLLLSGKSHALLWSGDFDQPSNKISDLKQQLAYSAANVLDCASEAYGPPGRSLDAQTRRLYLNGCGEFTRITGADPDTLVSTFREVVRRAPRFEGGWARLLQAEDEILYSPPFDHLTPQSRAQFRADIAEARRTNPDMAEAYIGEADAVPENDAVAAPLHLLDLAVEKNPNNPDALAARSNGLLQMGRMNEAVSDARRAVQIRPFSPRAQEGYISALTYAGQFDAAREEISKAEAMFPGATNVEEARYRLNLRYGSPQEALKQLQEGATLSFSGQDLFLKARIDPSANNVGLAVDAARRRLDGSSISTADYIQTLAAFGRTEELINYLLNIPQADRGGRFPGVLFRPAFHNFWLDPRAMQVAKLLGLLDYWQSSGQWPDFCSWPDLPYNCKKEAAKLTT